MKAMKLIALLILTFVSLFLSSCSDEPPQVLENKINVSIRSGNKIDDKEWNDLTKYILENKAEFHDLVEDDSIRYPSV